MSRTHDAPGQMAGYLFQVERALFWLSEGSTSTVGIEAGDDIVRLVEGAEAPIVREQDKHSSTSRTPFSDTGVDLWKTLRIWLLEMPEDPEEAAQIRYLLVTNKVLPQGGIARFLAAATSERDIDECLRRLRRAAATSGETVVPIAAEVLASPERRLRHLIRQIDISDGSTSSSGSGLAEKVIANLHVPSGMLHAKEEIFDSLIGWVYKATLEKIRSGKSVWISRASLDQQHFRILSLLGSKAFRETARHLIPLPEAELASAKESLFVRQLSVVCPDGDEDHLVDAVEDYLCATSQRTRLSLEGQITKDDFIAFDGRLIDRWKVIFARARATLPDEKDEKYESSCKPCGWNAYLDTIEHRESLAGQATEELYLTRGSYHRLANVLKLGWHPLYRRLFGSAVERRDE